MVRSALSLFLAAQASILGASATPKIPLLKERTFYSGGLLGTGSGSSSFSAACYFPDGSPAYGNVPCSSGGGASNCCGSASACLANGLCLVDTDDGLAATLNNGVEFARGACTDPTWSAPECFGQCRTSRPGSPSSNGAAVFECGSEGYAHGAYYCCENGVNAKTACCATPSVTFYLGPGTSAAATGSSSSSSAAPAPSSSTTPSVVPTASSATSSPAGVTTHILPSSSLPSSTVAQTATATANNTVTSTQSAGPTATPLQAAAVRLGFSSTVMAGVLALVWLFA